ncbi:CRISPR-associated protein Cas5 (plasmid) [Runella rosea]|uniref:CRISPR-associated protein Cas5 n=1 Tax=Runella rosea TaxID=2259595 RepID=A0A344TTH3_9BACT|nr:CRISPR-associated protein Cas5 [Runella rosea]AXE21944.1 CRISPR-associated protein Cas5 [Runella rosea]
MLHCVIEIRSVTASFRNPEFQNFHKSFRLPPPTTLIGLAGAALGLSPKSAQDFFEKDSFRAGVRGIASGMARDLWKYDTLPGRSVITREILMDTHYWIVFGCESQETIHQIKAAFDNPVFALTMGSSDSLAKIVKTELIESESESNELENALVEDDIIPLVLAQALKGGEFSFGVNDSDPIAYQLPTRFAYESDYGVRKIAARKLFSFIGPKVTFKDEVFRGVHFGDVFIPTFTL